MGRPKKVAKILATETKEPTKKEYPAVKLNIDSLKKDYNIRFASEIETGTKLRTGIYAFDHVLDGGIYIGEGGHRIELLGPESSGKTTLTLKIIALYQSLGKKCIFIDIEESFDKVWAETCGVDLTKLVIAEPKFHEQAGDLLVEIISKYDLIVMDSVASLVPKTVLEQSLEDRTMALGASLNAALTQKLYAAMQGQNTTLIFINQIREKVGGYGNPITSPGGRALRHFYNTRVEFSRAEFIEEDRGSEDARGKKIKDRIGCVNALKNIKNKRGRPFRVSAFDFYYDGFIDNRKSLLYAGIKAGIIQQAGAGWYTYKDNKVQGEKEFCSQVDESVWLEIEKEIWEKNK